MPPVRKKRPNVSLDNTRVRQMALEKLPGLAQSLRCTEMSKVSAKGKEKALPAVAEPNTDMVGSVKNVGEIPQASSVLHGIEDRPNFLQPSQNCQRNLLQKQLQSMNCSLKLLLKWTATKSSSYSKGCAATYGHCPKERRSEDESRQTTVPSPGKGESVSESFSQHREK
ncbi:EKA-like protein [Blumeria hordei DH14]|uniref:EKA-like protein n=1 Tax=Blumeria graminis f. sp. hordei (strain DH14) TaxID=546991 RepID=N1JR71_BLUG1|nr:EKA-like protein [Blumeria hordei DH14]